MLLPICMIAAQEAGYKQVERDGVVFQWRISGENLDFILSAPTDGWVAVGFDPTNKMKDANMIIGYVARKGATVEDHFGVGAIRHAPDRRAGGQNDIIEYDGSEDSDGTTLRVTIPLDSGDSADRALTAGRTYTVLLAYGRRDNTSSIHKWRDSLDLTL